MQSRMAVATMMTAVLGAQLTAQSTTPQAAENRAAQKGQVPTSTSSRVIVVSLEDRKLALVKDGKVEKIYTVAVGKPSTPSPEGTFKIERRVMNPTYSHNGRTVLPGPNNPVGSRWMGLSLPGYGIHGTNEPNSIGKAASHGCIRMAKNDVEELFSIVAVGDTVELLGKRNRETAQLFGDGPNLVPTAQPAAQTAMASTTTAPAQSANTPTGKSNLPGTMLTVVAGMTVTGSM